MNSASSVVSHGKVSLEKLFTELEMLAASIRSRSGIALSCQFVDAIRDRTQAKVACT